MEKFSVIGLLENKILLCRIMNYELCPKTEYFQGNWNFKLQKCHNTLKIIFYSYKKYLKICRKSTLINNYDNIHPKNDRQFYPVIFRTVS